MTRPKIFLLFCTVLFNHFLNPEVAHGVLEKYKNNRVFVCSSIYGCVNLARALNAGYTKMYGIDNDPVLVEHAKVIFPQDINNTSCVGKEYSFYYGGIEKFKNIILNINEPMTILLGSHYPCIDTEVYNSVLEELNIIQEHPIKTHTILIDYIHHAGTRAFGYVALEEIKKKLQEINADYRFTLAKGGHLEKEEGAILVAYLK